MAYPSHARYPGRVVIPNHLEHRAARRQVRRIHLRAGTARRSWTGARPRPVSLRARRRNAIPAIRHDVLRVDTPAARDAGKDIADAEESPLQQAADGRLPQT